MNLLFRVGRLHASFYVLDMGTVREVLDDLTDEWDWVSVLRLLRSEDGRDGDDFVLVDRGDLADRDRGRSEDCPDRTELYFSGNIFAETVVLRAAHTEVWSPSDDTPDRLWMNSFQ